MNAQRAPETSTLSDRQHQAQLECMLAAHHARAAEREARLRRLPTPRSQLLVAAKAPRTDLRPTTSPRMHWLRITRRDVAVFFLPVGLTAAMVLLAHWTGYLS